jgi:hypothetical protein
MKTRMKYAMCLNKSKCIRYVVNILQEMKTIETRRVSRVNVKTDPFTIS